MNKYKELKILASLIEKIESDKKSILMRSWFSPFLWLVCAIALLASFQYYEHLNEPLILVVVSALVGIIVGAVSIIQSSEKNWPVLKNHMNIESLKQRVDEINT